MTFDPIRLEIFKHLIASIAEEMGTVLRKSSYSPNIKERRDFSCAIFDPSGQMVAQAAHIPVHLGSMPLCVKAAVDKYQPDFHPGDIVIVNDPFHGGTHLPDITLVSPVFLGIDTPNNPDTRVIGYVACRAHHADVGGMTPGSMPVSREIYQEGLIIPPLKLFKAGILDKELLELILSNVRTPVERRGDLLAQVASNQRGISRLQDLVKRYGLNEVLEAEGQLLAYSERMTRHQLTSIPDGAYCYKDFLDNDGINDQPIPIQVTITIDHDSAEVDFTGSAPQQEGSVNAVYAITLSAVYYVFRSLLNLDVPNNSGCLVPIRVIAPEGTIVNALSPAPVAGGNVETSQRIVDVLLGALAQACPDLIPAASQGTMNNVSIGKSFSQKIGVEIPSYESQDKAEMSFTYYETIGGGMGARPRSNGPSALHSHMTNTLNTPIEALEYAYPIRVIRYEIRRGSGGDGKYLGGDGIIRDLEVLTACEVTLLTDRRVFPPYGLAGGEAGQKGENVLIRKGAEIPLAGKGNYELFPGDVLSIRTPGGGGYGVKLP